MARRLLVLIEDDWEVQGNGLGNVAQLQYLPAVFLLNLADQLGFRVTFMAEVMQQLAHRNHADRDRNLRAQANLWDETALMIKERGHDVQLHIHPQWHGAVLERDRFRVGTNWNLATYARDARERMIGEAISYLRDLLSTTDSDYSVRSFKAGQWGLQPSAGLLQDLANAGIRLVMGVGRGIVYQTAQFSADYAELEEATLPYYPDFDDIRRVSDRQRPLVVLPLPYYTVGPSMLLRQLTARRLQPARARDQRLYYHPDLPASEASWTPMGRRRVALSGLIRQRGDVRSLDIGSAGFSELKVAIDQIIRRAFDAVPDVVPIVLQSHTKSYRGNWHDLTRFFTYLVERYGRSIEFMTCSDFVSILPTLSVVGGDLDAG